MAKLFLSLLLVAVHSIFLVFSQNEVPKITPDYDELFLKVGKKQVLNCSVTTSDTNAKLSWSYPNINIKKFNAGNNIYNAGNKTVWNTFLEIPSFDMVNEGVYTCSLTSNASDSILLTIVKENKTEPVFEAKTSVNLSCSISIVSTEVTWLKVQYKNGVRQDVPVSELKDKKRFTAENNTLVISTAELADSGLYIARFTLPGQPYLYDCDVGFHAAPKVQDFKPKNLIEGDKMDLECAVKGYPDSKITWFKGNEELNISTEDSRHQIRPFFGDQNSKENFGDYQIVSLLIKHVEFSDAGDYICEAYSEHFNTTSRNTLTVRVKDKLAALWPFLGIVCEVVVLCTIIFIYEKRRNKQVQQEEKAAEATDGSSKDKKEGLRHRGTNNSTA